MASASPPVRLIVGLGNPGAEYVDTRHNAGFWLVDRLADRGRLSLRREARLHGDLGRLQSGGTDCWLLKPDTFMNRSGDALVATARFYRIEASEILVVHDELDLPPGAVRLKRGGGHGGHNGLRDITQKLGNAEFLRLRVGIGHPGSADRVVGYVLSRPSAEDRAKLDAAVDNALELLPDILAGQADRVMNQLNRRSSADERKE
jgi:peptidyl-tRNA hydrolase, PTH1 family